MKFAHNSHQKNNESQENFRTMELGAGYFTQRKWLCAPWFILDHPSKFLD
jgi:hypothetical protein